MREPALIPADFRHLRRAHDSCRDTGAYERGTDHDIVRYGSQSGACAHLHRPLT